MDRPTGVLLDVDGTLVDSNDAHARAWVRALAEAGVAVAFATVRRLIGKGGDKLLPEVSGIDAGSGSSSRTGGCGATPATGSASPRCGIRATAG